MVAKTKLESRVKVVGKPRPMTDANLAAFEKLVGAPLPPSYRAFMTTFGPGKLAGYFLLRGSAARRSGMSLSQLVELYRDNLDMYVDQVGQKARLKRLVPFADTVGGDILGFDRGAVVMVPGSGKALVRLADSFEAFVADVAVTKRFGEIVGDPDYEADATFAPM